MGRHCMGRCALARAVCEIWEMRGDAGRYGETLYGEMRTCASCLRDMGDAGRCGEVWGDTVWGDAHLRELSARYGRCGEMRGGMGRHCMGRCALARAVCEIWEMRGDAGRYGETLYGEMRTCASCLRDMG